MRMKGKTMKRKGILVLALAALAAAALAAGTSATPLPGFGAGAWTGAGTISGTGIETAGPPATFGGKLRFLLNVAKSGKVTGSGSWKLTMTMGGDFVGQLTGVAKLTASGTSTAVVLKGVYNAAGSLTYEGVTAPLKLENRPIAIKLKITRAGTCKVIGSSLGNGIKLTWAAKTGTGTCLA